MALVEEIWKVNLMKMLLSSYRMSCSNIVVKPFVLMISTAYITPITEKTMISILTCVSSCLISKRPSKNVNTVWHLYRRNNSYACNFTINNKNPLYYSYVFTRVQTTVQFPLASNLACQATFVAIGSGGNSYSGYGGGSGYILSGLY